ncbi:hypothetical protein AGR3A_Lc140146 [Agrobacterium tomkonis CFBP 6623]|uniref:Uncharacterized protein n=1 Tax=Agrobacterium tomkonis CFBP 6623 TaxID=1183432 RepID=A0A1S7RPG2_9HYPH|nr:hypothetical protein AGR3A_Lc140146 [Agrobacterium tomkonis CFBP 6623]
MKIRSDGKTPDSLAFKAPQIKGIAESPCIVVCRATLDWECFPEWSMTSLMGLPFDVLQQRFTFGETMLLADAGLTSTPRNSDEGGHFLAGHLLPHP